MALPIFRWPGGKRWLAPKIVPFLQSKFARYLEPFLGGGAILFSLEPSSAIASDINKDLITCYQALKEDGRRLLEELGEIAISKRHYYWVRDIWDPNCKFERAARLIYLMRFSWNGLYRVNRNGRFNVPYNSRMRKDILTENTIARAQAILRRTTLKCKDFEVTIRMAKEGDLIFADPPYFKNGRETFSRYNGDNTFRDKDQKRLAKCLREAENRGSSWVLTNGSLEQVLDNFPDRDTFAIPRPSTIASNPELRCRILEYIVLSNGNKLSALRQNLIENYQLVSK